MPSTIEKLRAEFTALTESLDALIREVPIKWLDRHSRNVVIIAPEFYFAKRSAEQEASQLRLKRRYDTWKQLVDSVFRGSPDSLRKKIKSADDRFTTWLEFNTNWGLSSDVAKNAEKFREQAAEYDTLLKMFATTDGALIVVPDTNALVAHADPVEYRALVGRDGFQFFLLPVVLGELDQLKNNHRNPEFREKVEKAIKRIKGWRLQGSLNSGVTVDRTITVKAYPQEPRMEAAPSWLDASVPDDRLIANVLDLQAADPSSSVILVTGDINLLNKADAAAITAIDFD